MFRISHVLGVAPRARSPLHRRDPDLVSRRPSPTSTWDDDYIARKFVDQTGRGYPSILLAAHGPGDRVLGFALADYFESIGYAYLDFIVAQAEQRGRGLGGALYEALREDLIARGPTGLFFEVPTDDPGTGARPRDLKANKTRLKFYERYGALPDRGHALRPADPPRAIPPSRGCSTTRLQSTKPLDADGASPGHRR